MVAKMHALRCNVKPNLPTAGLVFYTERAFFYTESARTSPSIEKQLFSVGWIVQKVTVKREA